MKKLSNVNYPLASFYRQKVAEAGLTPVDISTARDKLKLLAQELPEEKIKARIVAVCKYYRDIADAFYRYRNKVVPIEMLTDIQVLRFIKDKAKKSVHEYRIKYNPELFTWALNVVKSKDLNEVIRKVEEGADYEEVKGAILKAYEALEIEGDYFLRQVLDLKS